MTIENIQFNEQFKAVSAQPTNVDGSLKSNNWTTKLHERNLSAIIHENTVQIKDGQNGYQIPIAVLTNKALETAANGDVTFTQLLTLLSNGFLTELQRSTDEKIKQSGLITRATKNEPETHLISASDYEAMCLEEQTKLKHSLELAYHTFVESGVMTETILQQMRKKIDAIEPKLTLEQQAIYEEKLEIEETARIEKERIEREEKERAEKLATRQKPLVNAGFTKILPCIGYKDARGKSVKFNGFQANIDLSKDKTERQTALIESNYIPVYAYATDDKTGIIYFKEFEVSDSLI